MLSKLLKSICLVLALLIAASSVGVSVAFSNPEETEAAQAEVVQETETAVKQMEAPLETSPELTGQKADDVAQVTAAAATEAIPQTEPVEETVPEQTKAADVYTEVPLYFQTDYPNYMFGSGSIANNGCSVTCLAMVATYLTGHEYLPNELARYFGGVAENNIERLEKGAEAMQLPWTRMANFHKAIEALREGQVVIALMDSNSLFTTSQHFIVLTGYNEDGLIMVNDPYAPNYEKWDTKRAFVEGFTEGDICCGFSGAWAFDKSAMPEEPFLYHEEYLGGEPRHPEIRLTEEEIHLLASVIWVEARGECAEGQQAVAEVILNRIASDRFGDTLNSVLFAEGQFRSISYLDDAEPHQAQYQAIERALHGPYILPEDVVHFATFRTNNNVWGQIGGHIFCYES